MLRPQVMEIDQVVVTASPGDAITSAAFEVRRLLRREGRRSDLYARFIDPALLGEVLPLDIFPAPRPDVAILYHASIGQAEVTRFLLHRPEPLVMLYHNMSPAEPFGPYDPGFAALLEQGRRELEMLRERVALPLAVSSFNAADLESHGYRDVKVAPLIVDPSRPLAERGARAGPALRRPTAAAQAAARPAAGLPRPLHLPAARGPPLPRRRSPAPPLQGGPAVLHRGAEPHALRDHPQSRERGGAGRLLPPGGRLRHAQRARGVLCAAVGGDGLREADPDPGLRGDPRHPGRRGSHDRPRRRGARGGGGDARDPHERVAAHGPRRARPGPPAPLPPRQRPGDPAQPPFRPGLAERCCPRLGKNSCYTRHNYLR